MLGSLWDTIKKWTLVFIIITAFLGASGAAIDHQFLVGAYHWISTVLTGHSTIKPPTLRNPVKNG